MRSTWVFLVLLSMGQAAFGDAVLTDSLLANRAYLYERQEFRSHTGESNNLDPKRLYWGSSNSMILRFPVTSYLDGKAEPFDCGRDCRLNPRLISNNVLFDPDPKASERVDSPLNISDFFWVWGQFLDHDIVLTPVDKVDNGRSKEGREPFPILVPPGDPAFDPNGIGVEQLPFSRSKFRVYDGVRFQINENTAFIDASVVYGSDEKRANALRSKLPDGRLSPYLTMSRGPHR
ncbi:MAG: hypothetical protein KDD39_07025, partial [Bdellovibrionales bacterium]|nr:hypothetical protein [Bdellovibrionales bacterium]